MGHLDLAGIAGRECPKLSERSPLIADEFVKMCPSVTGGIFDFYKDKPHSVASLHYTFLNYKESGAPIEAEAYINYMKSCLTTSVCKQIENATRDQAALSLWFEMRFARITASVAYDAIRCKTFEGSLVEKIMGARAPFQSEAVSRGKNENLLL